MSCCGHKRQALRTSTFHIDPRQHPPTLQKPTLLTYVGGSALVVKGAGSGLTYLFVRDETLGVDERDVPMLAATGYFVKT
jgi:hypothetical protein